MEFILVPRCCIMSQAFIPFVRVYPPNGALNTRWVNKSSECHQRVPLSTLSPGLQSLTARAHSFLEMSGGQAKLDQALSLFYLLTDSHGDSLGLRGLSEKAVGPNWNGSLLDLTPKCMSFSSVHMVLPRVLFIRSSRLSHRPTQIPFYNGNFFLLALNS